MCYYNKNTCLCFRRQGRFLVRHTLSLDIIVQNLTLLQPPFFWWTSNL
ncbi:hypothetical protein SRB521_01639 [Intestinimonas butyriciproducens]|nr:hypothetical protein SRB521_01639 [Intestinimonas butyriciproducens]